jgi:Big-like domain-containing protein
MASHTNGRRKLSMSVLILLASAAACSSLDLWGEPHSASDQMDTGRVECPRQWGRIPLFFERYDYNDKMRDSLRRLHIERGPHGLEFHPTNAELSPAGPITNIPEFHDCQRFVSSDGTSFDSLFAIFASFRLDSVTRALSWERVVWSSSNPKAATVDSGGLVTGVGVGTTTISATSVVDRSRTGSVVVTVSAEPARANERKTLSGQEPRPVSETSASSSLSVPSSVPLSISIRQSVQAVPQIGAVTVKSLSAAAIFSYGPGYTPLAIGPNFNCLYVYFDATGVLRAKIVHVDRLDTYPTACLDAVDPNTAPGQILSVTKSPRRPPANLPAVARWDWDPGTRQYFIGIACNDAWCEVGRTNNSTSRSYVDGFAPVAGDHVVRVKGWYDEQVLAWRSSSTGPLEPSGILGTLIPAPNLGTLSGPAAFTSFVTVAYVALDTTAAKPGSVAFFKKKLNLNPAPVAGTAPPQWNPARLNKLELCFGTQSSCSVVWTSELPGMRCAATTFGMPIHRWWQRITAAGETTGQFRCVTRRDHSSYAGGIPATARWRWILSDDTIWTECTQGCCQTEVGGF